MLAGNGTLHVTGGIGSKKNSGGGAGGRVSLRFWNSEDIHMYPQMTEKWTGRIYRNGGEGVDNGGSGSQGTLFTTPCQAGFSGPFCEPCDYGWFKSDYSDLPCSL